MTPPTWTGTTRSASLSPAEAALRHRLADAAKRYDWPAVLAVLAARPDLANATRPDGDSWYTPLHQAAHAGAPADVVARLLAAGAWPSLRTASGDRPVDLTTRAELKAVLQPPVLHDLPADVRRRLELYLHATLRAYAQPAIDEHALRLPPLDLLLDLRDPAMTFHPPRTHARFHYRLSSATVLLEVFGRRHTITPDEVRVADDPGLGPVAVPPPDAPFRDLLAFAQSYNGYDLHGGSAGLSSVVQPIHHHWQQAGALPAGTDVDTLRACLFFQQRSHYWDGGSWDFGTEPFVAALLHEIRSRSAGTVPSRTTPAPP